MNRTENLLFTLAEECAEVAQRASKAARFGLDEVQPGQAKTNGERIAAELNDLWAVCEMLKLATVDRTWTEQKKAKVEAFLEYSERCGTLAAPVATAPETVAPSAYIEHHKGGDNLVWDKSGLRCTPLYAAPVAEEKLPQACICPQCGTRMAWDFGTERLSGPNCG